MEPETVVQLQRSPTGHLWMDLFEQMPVVSENPLSLLGELQLEAKVGRTPRDSKTQVLVACTDSQHTSLSRPTRETDTPDTTTMRRSRVQFEKPVPCESQFDLKKSVTETCRNGFRENRSHVARRSDVSTGTAGVGTSCERGVHSSRKKKSILHEFEEKTTKVQDERQYECLRRPESREQDRAERHVQDAQHSAVGDTSRNHS